MNTFYIYPHHPLAASVAPEVRRLLGLGVTHAAILGEVLYSLRDGAPRDPIPENLTAEAIVRGVYPRPDEGDGYLWHYGPLAPWLESFDAYQAAA